jgi:hypothetical protein
LYLTHAPVGQDVKVIGVGQKSDKAATFLILQGHQTTCTRAGLLRILPPALHVFEKYTAKSLPSKVFFILQLCTDVLH